MEPSEYQLMAELESSLWWYRALHEWIINRINSFEVGGKLAILDAGCGTGGLLCQLAESPISATLFGIDKCPRALDFATTKTNERLICSTVDHMPFNNEVFDIILCIDVLYHNAVDEKNALNESFRCLRSGGYLLLHVPAYQWLFSGHDRQVHTKRRYTSSTLSRILTDAGFVNVTVGYRLSLLFPAMVISRKLFNSTRSDVQRIPECLNRLLYAITNLESTITNKGIYFPFGGSVWAIARKNAA